MKEIHLVQQIIIYLRLKGHHVWRNNSGAIYIGDDRKRRIQMAPAGSPDIIGWQKGTGRFIGIECKIGKNTPTDLQSRFLSDLQKDNCIAIVAYDLSDVEKVL